MDNKTVTLLKESIVWLHSGIRDSPVHEPVDETAGENEMRRAQGGGCGCFKRFARVWKSTGKDLCKWHFVFAVYEVVDKGKGKGNGHERNTLINHAEFRGKIR